jgi:hypothetical protein
MLTMTLTDEEALVVRDVLEARRKEMVHEVHHTSHREFRDMLRHRLVLLEAVLGRLGSPPESLEP